MIYATIEPMNLGHSFLQKSRIFPHNIYYFKLRILVVASKYSNDRILRLSALILFFFSLENKLINGFYGNRIISWVKVLNFTQK